MIQNVVETIGGVGAYGIISVCLFLVVFSGALVWAVTRKASLCQQLSALPLEDEEATGDSHE